MSECCGGGKTKLIYACSGCSDVGKISDETARKLSKDGFGKMTCLAGIGANLSGFVQSAKCANENISIDGCPVVCAKKNLERVGVTPKSYVLTEMGLVKGNAPYSDKLVAEMVKKISEGKSEVSKKAADKGTCGCGGSC